MVAIDATATASSGASTAAGPAARGFGEFEDFLRLLTTQLQQQDPLAPMDAQTFTRQLVQFATVEQAMKANARIETLIETVRAGQVFAAAGFVGRTVELDGEELYLPEAGPARVRYRLATPAASVRITVRGEDDRTVATLDALPTTPGLHEVSWDGLDRAGRRLPAGRYRVALEAVDESGRALEADLGIVGRVEAVQFDGERLLLAVDGVLHPATAVRAVTDSTSSQR